MNNVALVTGAKGFLGSHVVDALLDRGVTVRALDFPDRPSHLNNDDLHDPSQLAFDDRDILAIDADDTVFAGCDYIFHCAGSTDHKHSTNRPESYLDANVMVLARVLQAARHHDIKKVVNFSSASVYGIPASPVLESVALEPLNTYGFSKLLGEQTANHWVHQFGVPCTTLRIFNAYGPRGESGGIISSFIEKRLTGEALILHGDGQQLRDFIHASDVANAALKAAENGVPGEAYNIGSGEPQSLTELAKLFGGEVIIKHHLDGGVKTFHGDIGKAMNALEWTPTIQLSEGIPQLLEYYRIK